MRRETITVAGGATEQGSAARGRLEAVVYEPGETPLDAGATATVSVLHPDGFTTPVPVLTGVGLDAAARWLPRAPASAVDGSAEATATERHPLVESRVQVAVTGGGAGTGRFLIIIE
jgi:hypothetical protein